MSLILDALQRSEQESEHSSQTPGLHTRHDLIDSSRAGPGYRWFIAVVLLALLALAVTWWGLRGPAELPRLPEPSSVVEPTVELKAEPESDHEPKAIAVALQPAHDFAEVVALYEQLSSAQSAAEPAGGRAQLSAAAEEPTAGEAEPALDIDGLTKLAQAELEAAPVEAHPAPLIVELSQRIKDQIPSIFFRKHDWSSAAATSSVHLNSGVYRVGDTVAPGLRLVEILPNSIVLDYRGEEFRLRALNSWVNL